jgi:hypothetical protein
MLDKLRQGDRQVSRMCKGKLGCRHKEERGMATRFDQLRAHVDSTWERWLHYSNQECKRPLINFIRRHDFTDIMCLRLM